MRWRIGFGLSLAFDFDYLLIDEILSVGDVRFRRKSKQAIMQKITKSNVLMVSHSIQDLKNVCNAGLLVHDGKLAFFNKIEDAIDAYQEVSGFTRRTKKTA